ncbi:FkbM family methyltransferase [Algoriphagus sp. AK58]|uniref:FkbM family methyltransferase n=1 Tax=Algoriphagus sp. AK58 TaxID=1406877 RepID=UPI0016502A9F|nr:hypothetical protein [Algoriphagus sp. AK58]
MTKVRLISKLLGLKGLILFILRRFGIFYTPELKALFKIFDWGIKAGINLSWEDRLLRVDWVSNESIFPVYLRPYSSDPQVFKQVLIDQELAPVVRFFSERGLELKQMIDGGGNIGLSTLYLLSFFPNLKSLLIEPHLGNCSVLVRNVPFQKGTLEKKALWSKSGWVFPKKDSSEWGFSVSGNRISANAQAIPSISLSEVFNRFPVGAVDYIKLDIEGAEEAVFLKDTHVSDKLRGVKCISVEPHSDSFKAFFSGYLRNLGFDVQEHGELIYGFNYG